MHTFSIFYLDLSQLSPLSSKAFRVDGFFLPIGPECTGSPARYRPKPKADIGAVGGLTISSVDKNDSRWPSQLLFVAQEAIIVGFYAATEESGAFFIGQQSGVFNFGKRTAETASVGGEAIGSV